MNYETPPEIVLTTDRTQDIFKKPLFVSIKKPHHINRLSTSDPPGGTTRQVRSRSEPILFPNDPKPVPLSLSDDKENLGATPPNDTSPSTTPTKFLNVSPNSSSPSIKFGVLSLNSPTKLAPNSNNTGRLFTDKQLEPTRILRTESEVLGRFAKGQVSKNQEVEEALTQIRATISPRKKMVLPTLMNTSQPELNCLSSGTVVDLISGKFSDVFRRILILDCRFDYEFKGGHILGALNIPQEEDLDNIFIKCDEHHDMGEALCLVFHCEFSSHRAPKAYKRLRAWDRKKHEQCYPKLIFPEMYLLEGGYKKFFEECPDWCEPQGYIEMKDSSYVSECRMALMTSKGRAKSCRRFFSRSCTNIIEEMSTPITTSITPNHPKRNSPFASSIKDFSQPPRDSPTVLEKRQTYAQKDVEVEAENQN